MSSNSGWLVCEHSGGSKVRVGVEEGKSGQAPKNDTYRVCVCWRACDMTLPSFSRVRAKG